MKPYYEHAGITIYNADCRDVLPSIRCDAVVTDPPYGCGVTYGLSYVDDRDTYWEWFIPVVAMLRECAPTMALHNRVEALRHVHGWDWIGVWDKMAASGVRIGNSPLAAQWEPIFFFGIHTLGVQGFGGPDVFPCVPQGAGVRNGLRGRAVWETGPNLLNHPTPKPLSLTKTLLSMLTTEGQTVLDAFCGSGTTLRAAKDMGRLAIGIEIEERYCEIAAKRLAQEVLPLEMA